MQCTTIKGYNGNEPIMGPKVKFASLAKANIKLAKINRDPKNFIKRVVYKCEECGFYHIGKTLEMLKKKVPKRKQFLLTGMKVVGQVDLSQFDHLSTEAVAERKRLKIENLKKQKDKERERRKLFQQGHEVFVERNKAKELREFRMAKITKLKSTPSKLIGHFSTKYGVWMYFVKKKIVKIITTEGKVRHVKLSDIFSSDTIDSYNFYGDTLPSKSILFYMKENQDKLH